MSTIKCKKNLAFGRVKLNKELSYKIADENDIIPIYAYGAYEATYGATASTRAAATTAIITAAHATRADAAAFDAAVAARADNTVAVRDAANNAARDARAARASARAAAADAARAADAAARASAAAPARAAAAPAAAARAAAAPAAAAPAPAAPAPDTNYWIKKIYEVFRYISKSDIEGYYDAVDIFMNLDNIKRSLDAFPCYISTDDVNNFINDSFYDESKTNNENAYIGFRDFIKIVAINSPISVYNKKNNVCLCINDFLDSEGNIITQNNDSGNISKLNIFGGLNQKNKDNFNNYRYQEIYSYINSYKYFKIEYKQWNQNNLDIICKLYCYYKINRGDNKDIKKKILQFFMMLDNIHDFGKSRGNYKPINICKEHTCMIEMILNEYLYPKYKEIKTNIQELEHSTLNFEVNNFGEQWEVSLVNSLKDKLFQEYTFLNLREKIQYKSYATDTISITESTFIYYSNMNKKKLNTAIFDGNTTTRPCPGKYNITQIDKFEIPMTYDNTNVEYSTTNEQLKRQFDKKYYTGGTNIKDCINNDYDICPSLNIRRADIAKKNIMFPKNVENHVNEFENYMKLNSNNPVVRVVATTRVAVDATREAADAASKAARKAASKSARDYIHNYDSTYADRTYVDVNSAVRAANNAARAAAVAANAAAALAARAADARAAANNAAVDAAANAAATADAATADAAAAAADAAARAAVAAANAATPAANAAAIAASKAAAAANAAANFLDVSNFSIVRTNAARAAAADAARAADAAARASAAARAAARDAAAAPAAAAAAPAAEDGNEQNDEHKNNTFFMNLKSLGDLAQLYEAEKRELVFFTQDSMQFLVGAMLGVQVVKGWGNVLITANISDENPCNDAAVSDMDEDGSESVAVPFVDGSPAAGSSSWCTVS